MRLPWRNKTATQPAGFPRVLDVIESYSSGVKALADEIEQGALAMPKVKLSREERAYLDATWPRCPSCAQRFACLWNCRRRLDAMLAPLTVDDMPKLWRWLHGLESEPV